MKDLYLYITQRIHPGSILVAAAFDLLWSLFEGGSTLSLVGIIFLPILMGTVFIASFGAVTLIQRLGAGDDWGAACSKGLILGILAAVPFSVIGVVGAAIWGALRLTYGVDQEVILLGKLTRSWREIESRLRRLAPQVPRTESLEKVIDSLYDRRLLSRTLKDQLHELRRQRNINMHEVSTDELDRLVQEVQAMERTLQARFLYL
jgi:hypothetical protein